MQRTINMPKVKSNNEGKSQKTLPPYQQRDEFPAKMQRTVKNGNEVGTKNTNEYQKNVKSDPLSTENVLKCFMQHHKKSLDSTTKKSLDIIENMQKINMAVLEVKQENANLKKK